MAQSTKTQIGISGMTCTSCEVIIERKLKKLPGVTTVNVNHRNGLCTVEHDAAIPITHKQINDVIAEKGYRSKPWNEHANNSGPRIPFRKQLREFGSVLLIMFALYLIFKTTGILNIDTATGDTVNLGTAFVIGLIAATSTCIALVGGFILSVSTTFNQLHPNATPTQKFRPHILFNIGRLISYFILGGVVGWIGKALTPSPAFTGVLGIVIALVMILLAIDILKLFPTARWIPRMPKFITHKLYAVAESKSPWAPLLLGGMTFFLPCGFTQSMQLYALTTGSFWQGAITMFMFALGTLPALVGIGALTSWSKGGFAKRFMKVAGSLVLLLGLYNLNNGLALAGFNTNEWFGDETSTTGSSKIVNDIQVVNMSVKGLKYLPDNMNVQVGVPVEWHIDGSGASGCSSVIVVPDLKISQPLSRSNETIITFTPERTGKLSFTCGMGMTYGQFTVTDAAPADARAPGVTTPACDPTIQNCV